MHVPVVTHYTHQVVVSRCVTQQFPRLRHYRGIVIVPCSSPVSRNRHLCTADTTKPCHFSSCVRPTVHFASILFSSRTNNDCRCLRRVCLIRHDWKLAWQKLSNAIRNGGSSYCPQKPFRPCWPEKRATAFAQSNGVMHVINVYRRFYPPTRWTFLAWHPFVCLFVCSHDNFRTIKHRMMKLGG